MKQFISFNVRILCMVVQSKKTSGNCVFPYFLVFVSFLMVSISILFGVLMWRNSCILLSCLDNIWRPFCLWGVSFVAWFCVFLCEADALWWQSPLQRRRVHWVPHAFLLPSRRLHDSGLHNLPAASLQPCGQRQQRLRDPASLWVIHQNPSNLQMHRHGFALESRIPQSL